MNISHTLEGRVNNMLKFQLVRFPLDFLTSLLDLLRFLNFLEKLLLWFTGKVKYVEGNMLREICWGQYDDGNMLGGI